jgi:menaquinone-9 beta-reductase
MIDRELLSAFDKFQPKQVAAGWRIFSPSGKTVRVNFTKHGFVSRRIDFDNFLFGEAMKIPGLEFRNMEIREVKTEPERISVLGREGESISAGLLIGCDGAHSAIARQMGMRNTDPSHNSGAVRAYYSGIRDIEPGIIEIHLIKGYLPGYFWIFPLGPDSANVGFGMLSRDISKRKIDLRSSVKEILSGNAELRKRFEGASLEGKVDGFSLPLGGLRRRISGTRFMLCGDAASLIDPLNGEGIGNGMLSGYYAAEHALKCFAENNFSEGFIAGYDEIIGKKLLPELRAKLSMQRVFNRPWLIDLLVAAGVASPAFRKWMGRRL